MIAVGVLVVVAVVAAILILTDAFKSQTDEDRDTATDRCLKAVAGKLMAPTTAKYSDVLALPSSLTDHETELMRGDFPKFDPSSVSSVWDVSGSVDAQNNYGAMLRSSFTCAAIFINGRFSNSYASLSRG